MSSTFTALVKVALIRDQSTPIGQPGRLYLNCRCGAKPAASVDGTDVRCTCGKTYNAGGWLIAEEG
jgi:hypothetical protein